VRRTEAFGQRTEDFFSAPADRGQDRDLAPIRERGREAVSEPDAVLTDEEVDVRAHFAPLVEHAPDDSGKRVFERAERFREGPRRARDLDVRSAAGEIAERSRHEELDRHQAAFRRRAVRLAADACRGRRARALPRTVAARTHVICGRLSQTADQLSPSSRDA
jgi:hypothetical protein